jgi:hypothetical protein
MVEQTTHNTKIKGLNLAKHTAEKDLKKGDVLLKGMYRGCTGVEHSTHNTKIKGLNPANVKK